MSAGKINLQCDVAVKDILCRAIRDYAYAAYPEGGSDCAQVARYTLLELAQQIDAGITPDRHCVEISRRPRAMFRAALEYYFELQDAASGEHSTHQRELMQGLLRGEMVTQPGLIQARAEDASARVT